MQQRISQNSKMPSVEEHDLSSDKEKRESNGYAICRSINVAPTIIKVGRYFGCPSCTSSVVTWPISI